VAIGNPPYYADFRIAERFIRSAAAALRPGGKLLMVTKSPERYFETLPDDFDEITAEEIKGYVVVRGVKT
jgi:16S rRNA (guanine1207-N2)-methyltransferase